MISTPSDLVRLVEKSKISIHKGTMRGYMIWTPEIRVWCGSSLEVEALRHEYGGNGSLSWHVKSASVFQLIDKVWDGLVKRKRHAEILRELAKTYDKPYTQLPYWYAKEHPDWKSGELLTIAEAARFIGMTAPGMAAAADDGSVLALPRDPELRREQLRVCADFLTYYKGFRTGNRGRSRLPPQIIEWRDRLHEEMLELNGITQSQKALSPAASVLESDRPE